ncbi:GNAT family N-acetyltransferase [Flavobacterium sp. RSB2_4_14]|uniref:GNAT family N-acetyltransferase n=1 Tax=Flavobacterium sp. RSB2_4_14 TaxID=3447665 RepID=UPI003F3ED6DC
MISLVNNTDYNFTDIRAIAHEVWPIAYGDILSNSQLDYMMKMMYSVEALQIQADIKRHHFILAIEDGVTLGFASYEFNYSETNNTKIHKIYILSHQQGKGIGKLLIEYIESEAKKQHQEALCLNVNKYNVAQHFYKKLGFSIRFEEVIDIGEGYVMDDYVMEKKL